MSTVSIFAELLGLIISARTFLKPQEFKHNEPRLKHADDALMNVLSFTLSFYTLVV